MKKLQKHFWLILAVAALIAMAISFTIGLSQSVWFDEAYSLIIAKRPISKLIGLTAVDVHPPLYYLLLKGWASVFGWAEPVLRSLSVLFLGGTIIFAGLLMKKLFDKRTAIITLPFIVFSPFLLRYGFELRMYSLAALICIAATYVLICALESKKDYKIWGLYALLVALGVYTHYYTVLLWTAHLIWLAWQDVVGKKPIIKSPWLKAYIASIILFIPWLPAIYYQVANGVLASVVQPMTIENLVGIVSFGFLYRPIWGLDAALSVVVMLVILAINYLSKQTIKLSDKKIKAKIMLLVMYIVIPVVFLTIVGLVRPMYLERYMAHVIIGGYLFIGVAFAILLKRKNNIAKIVYIFLICVMMLGVVQLGDVGNFSFQRLQHPKTREATATVNCDGNTAILADSPYVAVEIDYYLSSDCPVYFYSDNARLGGGYAPLADSDFRLADTVSQLAGFEEIHYLYYGDSKLQMPESMNSVSKHEYGKLNVEKFQSSHLTDSVE